MADCDRPTRRMNGTAGLKENAAKGKASGAVAPDRTHVPVRECCAAPAPAPEPVIASDIDALYEIIRSGKEVQTRLDAAAHLFKLIDEDLEIDPGTVAALYNSEKDISMAAALKRALNKIRIRRSLFKDPTVPYDRVLSPEETERLKAEINRLRGLYDRFQGRKGAFDRKYHRLEKIEQGVMARIYRAIRREDNREVAIKFLLLDDLSGRADAGRLIARFQREGELLTRRLDHPRILKGYEYGEAGGEHFIVLEYVAGGDLDDLIAGQPLDRYLFREIALQLCDAVRYIHRKGVIHRDIKPANILIDRVVMGPVAPGMQPMGGSPRVSAAFSGMAQRLAISIKLADFGLAKDRRDNRLSRFSYSAGTDDFSSPQQLADARDADERDDIFSMGKTFYAMLTGRVLKSDEPYRPLALAEAGRSEAINALIAKCIALERSDRWQSVSELDKALRQI